MKGTVYLMLSGGVDSSVAAITLKQKGSSVIGVYMKCWSMQQLQSLGVDSELYACTWEDDIADARSVAKKLEIAFEVWDFESNYRQGVVDYMLTEYKAGRTPNPDVMCNSLIKFGIFFKKAMGRGADYVATGHYARIVAGTEGLGEQNLIARGLDHNKDQSYFLWSINPDYTKKILLPIGDFNSKQEVRQKAEEYSLITSTKKDSQGLCFVGKTPLRELLLQTLGTRTGEIVDLEGKKLGTHPGAYLYTIGQREKLGLGGGPWYVCQTDISKNQVIVAHLTKDEALYSKQVEVFNFNWFIEPEVVDQIIIDKFTLEAQTRYRQPAVKGQIIDLSKDKKRLVFEFFSAVRAVAKGQSFVLYSKDLLLGGGVLS